MPWHKPLAPFDAYTISGRFWWPSHWRALHRMALKGYSVWQMLQVLIFILNYYFYLNSFGVLVVLDPQLLVRSCPWVVAYQGTAHHSLSSDKVNWLCRGPLVVNRRRRSLEAPLDELLKKSYQGLIIIFGRPLVCVCVVELFKRLPEAGG